MAIAIAVNDGVVAAVIPSAHTAALDAIAVQRRDIAERARAGKLRPADIADATFTISNLGMFQVDQFPAIITPPRPRYSPWAQSAITSSPWMVSLLCGP